MFCKDTKTALLCKTFSSVFYLSPPKEPTSKCNITDNITNVTPECRHKSCPPHRSVIPYSNCRATVSQAPRQNQIRWEAIYNAHLSDAWAARCRP